MSSTSTDDVKGDSHSPCSCLCSVSVSSTLVEVSHVRHPVCAVEFWEHDEVSLDARIGPPWLEVTLILSSNTLKRRRSNPYLYSLSPCWKQSEVGFRGDWYFIIWSFLCLGYSLCPVLSSGPYFGVTVPSSVDFSVPVILTEYRTYRHYDREQSEPDLEDWAPVPLPLLLDVWNRSKWATSSSGFINRSLHRGQD